MISPLQKLEHYFNATPLADLPGDAPKQLTLASLDFNFENKEASINVKYPIYPGSIRTTDALKAKVFYNTTGEIYNLEMCYINITSSDMYFLVQDLMNGNDFIEFVTPWSHNNDKFWIKPIEGVDGNEALECLCDLFKELYLRLEESACEESKQYPLKARLNKKILDIGRPWRL